MSRFIKGEPSKGVTFKKGQTPWNKGKKMNDEYRKKVSDFQKGRKQTAETIAKRASSLSKGSLNRKGKLYQEWRNAVLERDKICRHCDTKDRLVAHHKVDYKNLDGSKNKGLMLDVNNGLTLCSACHIKLHNTQDNTGFKKKMIPWNKGRKGLVVSPLKGIKTNRIPWNKGTKGISGGWDTRREHQRLKEINNINN